MREVKLQTPAGYSGSHFFMGCRQRRGHDVKPDVSPTFG